MNRKILVLVLSVFLLTTVNLFSDATDPALGYWKSIDEKDNSVTGVWKTEVKSDGLLYGCLVWIPDDSPTAKATYCTKVNKYTDFMHDNPSALTVLNTLWLYKLKYVKPGVWNRGHIIDPSDGNHYYGGVKYEDGILIMRGSLDKAGVLGRSQRWQKISEAEVKKLIAEANAKYGL